MIIIITTKKRLLAYNTYLFSEVLITVSLIKGSDRKNINYK